MGFLGLASKGDVRDSVNEQKDRISSFVALQLAILPKATLKKKIKYSAIPFLSYTIFKDMVPYVKDDDGKETDELDYNAKVTINDLLYRIDP